MNDAPGLSSRDAATSTDQSTEQVRFFDADRYAPVRVAMWQRLPESSARAFGIASGLGNIIHGDGSRRPTKTGKEAAGSIVRKAKLPAVLTAIGIEARQWRRYREGWVDLFTAHRCSSDQLCLFMTPEPEVCPGCGGTIEYDHVPNHHRRTKAARQRGGRSTTAEAVAVRPNGGASTTGGAARVRPEPERDAAHPSSGSLLGLEVGVSVCEGITDDVVTDGHAIANVVEHLHPIAYSALRRLVLQEARLDAWRLAVLVERETGTRLSREAVAAAVTRLKTVGCAS